MSEPSSKPKRKPTPQTTFIEPGNLKKQQITTNVANSNSKKSSSPIFLGENNRYRLEKMIGSGMSQVYLASDTNFGNKPVVVKVINPSSNQRLNKHLIQRFKLEVSVLASLNSLNIVQVKDFGFADQNTPFASSPFYVMEYIKGQTLSKRLKEVKFLSTEQALSIMIQICSGLQEAHQQNIVHRDLKPDNILLVPVEELGELVKIIDFGIAKIINSPSQPQITQIGSFIGTYRYASPEQCDGNPELDQRSDIYSLGLILYEILTGSSPYNMPSEERGWIRCHLIEKPIPLRNKLKDQRQVGDLENIIIKCLEKPKINRFSNISQFKQALKVVLNKIRAENTKKIQIPTVEEENFVIENREPQIINVSRENIYSGLRELLTKGDWQEANQETANILLKVVNRETAKFLDINSINDLTCDILYAIDQLWKRHSQERFGFTAQKQIWQELGGKIDTDMDYITTCELGRRLGWFVNNQWKKTDQLIFTLDAPLGHLPHHWRLTWDPSLIISKFASCQ